MQWRYESTASGTTPQTIERITLPAGNYEVICGGAKGGAGNGSKSAAACIGGYGATVAGTLHLTEDTDFLLAVGNPGTDHPGTSGDGATGAGGGGTYFTMIVDADHPGAVLTSGFSNSAFNSLYVIPILVAAGGNGGRDYGYSGTGTIYHGVHTTDESYVSGERPGGCFASLTASSQYNGSNFVNGGHAATYAYNRAGTSYAGFGGGASNRDDGEGGGGGGYYGGHTTKSACSYSHPELITSFSGTTGTSATGYVQITSLELPGPYVAEGSIEFSLNEVLPQGSLDTITIFDERRIPEGTLLQGYLKTDTTSWTIFTPGEEIDVSGAKNVYLKYVLSTENPERTPVVRKISARITQPRNLKQIIVSVSETNKFHNALGEVEVLYDGSVPISDTYGILVEPFSASFIPINVVKKENPGINEQIIRTETPGSFTYTHIGTIEVDADDSSSLNLVSRTEIPGSFSFTKINNVNP